MRIFLSEFLTCGAWDDSEPPASLFKEGLAMFRAVIADFLEIPNCQVSTTWDQRLGECPLLITDRLHVQTVENPAQEQLAFAELAQQVDVAMVIAPEFQNLLAERCQQLARLNVETLNCSVEAIRQCTDKFALAGKLEAVSLPTIPTWKMPDFDSASPADWKFPFVVKPRDGAGSLDTFLIPDQAAWETFQQRSPAFPNRDWIGQPYVAGDALSVAAIVGEPEANGKRGLEVFPLATQQLTRDGRFTYLGGRMPETISLQHFATQRVREIVQLMPGLSGYVGFDLLCPRENPEELWIVEINPRLTTSYLGYRALADGNLAEYLLPELRGKNPLRWKPRRVTFTAEGTITWNERT